MTKLIDTFSVEITEYRGANSELHLISNAFNMAVTELDLRDRYLVADAMALSAIGRGNEGFLNMRVKVIEM